MPKMKPHSIKFDDRDWETIKDLADAAGMSAGAWVAKMCRAAAEYRGAQWHGDRVWGKRPQVKENNTRESGGMKSD